MEMIEDPKEIVRQSVAWTIGQIAIHSLCRLDREMIKSIVDVLLHQLHDHPSIIATICKVYYWVW